MFENEIYKSMKEIASLNGNEMIPTLTIYNMTHQLFKGIKTEDVSVEFHNALNKLSLKGDIYEPKKNYWKVTNPKKQQVNYNQIYEKEEMLGVSIMGKTKCNIADHIVAEQNKKSMEAKLEEIFADLLAGVKTDETELTELENLNDRISRLENALLELAYYPSSNEFNRDDVNLALRKAGIIKGGMK